MEGERAVERPQTGDPGLDPVPHPAPGTARRRCRPGQLVQRGVAQGVQLRLNGLMAFEQEFTGGLHGSGAFSGVVCNEAAQGFPGMVKA